METNTVSSKNVMEMLTVANEYCHFIEKAHEYETKDILDYLQKMFSLLYLKGALLPTIEVQVPEANERFVTEQTWESIFNELRNKFKPNDEFWVMDHIDFNDNEPIKASLADNLTDIYQDLKDFVLLYAKGTDAAKENAVHDCRLFFQTHWGYRLVQSQKYIHHLMNADIKKQQNDIY
ncbi:MULTISPECIES: DUF5063 domain-containing protein [unclassified Lentimicrobium]|uniref:DUF5063 domain-containing protein n=1 Tax=unclassified Lentimicrobium TaxID=2677434 RepID=UPI0015518157|nr:MULTISPECIES: DUF5063 domain-containing protein [unclassified Lentimicrobium]NPD46585.1 DUF5063 domain-containing protein [Lentimicrobium sp. S6]NPD85728.1 DUF5063 domain-containing protein [Lentimicrobium sp. L6]